MKFITISALAISMASFAFAWTVTDYSGAEDCNIIGTNHFYRAYEGTDSNACHDFGAGESGSTCSQHTWVNKDVEITECGSDIVESSSVNTGSSQCEFFESIGCDGASRIVPAYTCVKGAYKSFSCVSFL